MALITLLFAVLGSVVGSFLNVVADRVPVGGSLLKPNSRCDSCKRDLAPGEMVPVISYLVLKGKCRECGAEIPQRVLWTEVATAVLYVMCYWRYGLSLDLAWALVFGSILVAIFVIDLEHKLVLNKIVLPATVVAAAWAFLRAYAQQPPFDHYGLMGPLLVMAGARDISASLVGLVSQLLGGVVAFGIFWLIWMITPGGMGAGDVKLAALAGILTAFPGCIVAVFGSFVLGGVVAIALIAIKVAGRKSTIPFAPFLVVTTLAVMLWGEPLLHWYLGF